VDNGFAEDWAGLVSCSLMGADDIGALTVLSKSAGPDCEEILKTRVLRITAEPSE
jgi:hypothetical protein